ncbi:hypothetical protein [Gordonia terrae]|uniref:hypothetical protein n=1 Tax=Gordonia terrae TaxID=2055 RepID=UPI003F6AB1E0
MKISRVLAALALGALAVAVVAAAFFLIRSPEPSLASDAVPVDVAAEKSQQPGASTTQAQAHTQPLVPQTPPGAPVPRAVAPNLYVDDDDRCDNRPGVRDDDCDDQRDDIDDQRDDRDDGFESDDQHDDWDDGVDDDRFDD